MKWKSYISFSIRCRWHRLVLKHLKRMLPVPKKVSKQCRCINCQSIPRWRLFGDFRHRLNRNASHTSIRNVILMMFGSRWKSKIANHMPTVESSIQLDVDRRHGLSQGWCLCIAKLIKLVNSNAHTTGEMHFNHTQQRWVLTSSVWQGHNSESTSIARRRHRFHRIDGSQVDTGRRFVFSEGSLLWWVLGI